MLTSHVFPTQTKTCHRIINDRSPSIFLWMTVFCLLYVASLAVLIRRIIGNINFLTMISFFIPVIKKSNSFIFSDFRQKPRDGWITVYLMIGCQHWRIVCIIRIILGCVVLTDNGIRCQIQEQYFSTVVSAAQVVLKFIIINDLFNYKKNSDTCQWGRLSFWHSLIPRSKEFQQKFSI